MNQKWIRTIFLLNVSRASEVCIVIEITHTSSCSLAIWSLCALLSCQCSSPQMFMAIYLLNCVDRNCILFLLNFHFGY